MIDHKFDTQKMICTGMVLGLASDLRPQGKFNFLQNIRISTEGELRSRPKIFPFLSLNPALPKVPHTIKTIVNKITGGINRIVGVDTEIYTGSIDPLNQKVSGFSGDPLSIVDFRPEEAVETYAYIADRNKMCKISVGDVVSDIGINVPTKALQFSHSAPNRKIIDNITPSDVADWDNLTGSAGTPTIENRIDTTIEAILYDTSTPSYASIVPDTFSEALQSGTVVILDDSDEVVVEEILPSTLLSGTAVVNEIVYDSGPSGTCLIVLSVPDVSIRRNTILLIDGSEYVRVLDVTRDNNNIPSIRTITVGAYIGGESVTGVASFRVFANSTYLVGQNILADGLITSIGAAGVSSIEKTFDVDLTNTGSKALTDNDILHCSIKVDNPALMTEIQLQFKTADPNNYWYYVISPNFFTGSASQTTPTISTIQQTVQREELVSRLLRYGEYYDTGIDPILYLDGGVEEFRTSTSYVEPTVTQTPVSQTVLGQNQWTEFFIRIGNLLKVGSNEAITKKDIKSIKISINCTAAIIVGLDSLWVGGGSSPQAVRGSSFLPYNYIWRVREKETKSVSNWSPPLREGIFTNRTSIELTPTDAATDFPSTYVIDIARFGGTLNDYRIIGTVPNDGSVFIDNVSDLVAAQNAPAGRRLSGNQIGSEEVFDFYKPFTFLDVPKSGICNVIGTQLTIISGDSLDTSYPRGVQIIIGGILNRFYTNPTDSQHVELERDMGSVSNTPFEIRAPLLTGQPLPTLFGPFGEGNSGLFIFGIGNKKAAGTVYWLDGNSPDTQSDINFLEITSPSELLLAGVIYDSYGYVYSNKRSFLLIPTYQAGALNFIARENAGSRGVFSPWSICVGKDAIYYLTDNADGIVKVAGTGIPRSLTNGTIYNLFPHDGTDPQPVVIKTGVDSITIQPPDFSNIKSHRLFWSGDHVEYRFVDLSGNHRCLIFDERIDDWISYDVYADDKVDAFYKEEIESNFNVLVGIEGGVGRFLNGLTGRENDLKSIVVPFCADQGDSRMLKNYDEIVFDINRGTGGFDYNIFYNNGEDGDLIDNIIGATLEREKIARVINFGLGKLARNISCKTSWKLSSDVKIYEQQYYFIPRADQINDRASDIEDAGIFGDKFWQGVTIEADTFGIDKELIFYDDDGNERAALIINHNGKQTLSYSFDLPWISHKIIRTSNDGIEWIHYNSKYKFDIEPELGKVWETQESSLQIPGFKVIQRIGIVARTNSEAILKIYYDDVVEEYTIDNSNDDKEKQFFFVRPRKGKLLKFRLESDEPFRVYSNDLEIWIRHYSSPNSYQPIRPFGAEDYKTGAQI